MKAEFTRHHLAELPQLIVIAESEIEWRALQLYLKLMDYHKTVLTIQYCSEGKDNAKIPPEDNPFAE